MDPAKIVSGAFCAGTWFSGQRPYSTSLRIGIPSSGTVDAGIYRCTALRMGLLAARHGAGSPRRSLPTQLNGALDPGPIDHPIIPIHIAAVNPYMCRVAGEVADGVRAHPVSTPKYIAEVMLPAVADGAARRGRDPRQVAMCMKPLVATAADEATLAQCIETVRARIAFYASTPGYRAAFEVHGLGELADRLSQYSRAQRWQEMEKLIDNDVLHTYAVVGTYDEIGDLLKARFGKLVTHLEFSIPVDTNSDKTKLRSLLTELRSIV